jgi:hypothetical protein
MPDRNLPPRLATLPRPVQVQLLVGGPVLFGLVVGFFLGISPGAYWALTAAALLGGLAGGLEHCGGRAGARRGVVAGTLFAGGLLLASEVSGDPALAELPSPPILLVPLSAAIGTGLGAAGGTLRTRLDG